MPEMEPAVRDFLERACESAQQYDREGQAVLPNSAWPRILEELGLQDESEGAYFLMDHLEAHGEGYFTYLPLLQALGVALPEEVRGPPSPAARTSVAYGGGNQGNGNGPTPLSSTMRGLGDLDQAQPRAPGQPLPPMGGGGGCGASYGVPRLPSSPQGSAHPSSPQGSAAPGYREDLYSDAGGSVMPQEEVGEAFWARRANGIQQLFTRWDCNKLSNETFTASLQDLLGDSVDITNPESEFLRKTNQHRSARNLKFAALMSALRRDAEATTRRRMGLRPATACSYTASYAGSAYGDGASEMGSEATHAAGRPTGVPSGLRGVQRQRGPESVLSSSDAGSGMRPTSILGGPMPGYNSYSPSERSYAPSERPNVGPLRDFDDRSAASAAHPSGGYGGHPAPAPRSPGSIAESLGDHGGPPSRQQAGPDPELFWSGGGSRLGTGQPGGRASGPSNGVGCDQSDVMSQSGFTDVAGVADSQREVFTLRNRTGHGNILTWGTDSRSITPHKKREGRQITQDNERGIPRSAMSSGIFPQR